MKRVVILVVAAAMMAACGGSSSGKQDNPEQVAIDYITAQSKADFKTMKRLSTEMNNIVNVIDKESQAKEYGASRFKYNIESIEASCYIGCDSDNRLMKIIMQADGMRGSCDLRIQNVNGKWYVAGYE